MADSTAWPQEITVDPVTGVVEFPVHHMRGGTSTGLVIHESMAPAEVSLREELLRHLMGVPLQGRHQGNRQITGLGRGPATSNKVFLVATENGEGRTRLVSTLAQLAADHAAIDWSVNCGNMSSALPLWALDQGLFAPGVTRLEMDIRNTNTGVLTGSRLLVGDGGVLDMVEIPGVDGAFPGVDLFLYAPIGAKTGRLLPTGQRSDVVHGYTVSCVDVAVPMVIADAAEFGKTAQESIAELEQDADFMQALRALWIAAGEKMQLKRPDGQPMSREEIARSETIPKVCIVGPATGRGTIAARYFTPQSGHASMAVSGGCCLAAATLLPGTVAARVAHGQGECGPQWQETIIGIENPAGILESTVLARLGAEGLEVAKVAYRRNAQILARGHVPLYRATPALRQALLAMVATGGQADRRRSRG
jgi:4-oxalomesaconate tautomerase